MGGDRAFQAQLRARLAGERDLRRWPPETSSASAETAAMALSPPTRLTLIAVKPGTAPDTPATSWP